MKNTTWLFFTVGILILLALAFQSQDSTPGSNVSNVPRQKLSQFGEVDYRKYNIEIVGYVGNALEAVGKFLS